MKVLLVKTSSLGDVVHTFPAITDALGQMENLQLDWVVEEAFVPIASLHPGVNNIIPCAIRRWRKNIFRTLFSGEWRAFKKAIREQEYDLVIDAQGLLKSAFITRLARGRKAGYDTTSAREGLSSFVLHEKIAVAPSLHAIERTRLLFASALGYQIVLGDIDYGLAGSDAAQDSIMFLHGTTWSSKLWPLDSWKALALLCADNHLPVSLPWGNEEEKQRAQAIAETCPSATVLPEMSLADLARHLAGSRGVVSVDTGLGHLAAAFELPVVAIYGSTNPEKTGLVGRKVCNLAVEYNCAPCFKRDCPLPEAEDGVPPCYQTVSADKVYRQLQEMLG